MNIFKAILGKHIAEKYVEAKKAEWAELPCTQVTEWEISEYLYKI